MPTVESTVEATGILDERARHLALPLDPPSTDGDLHLVVRAGGQRVALRMSALRAVVPPPPVTRLRIEGLMFGGLVVLAGEVVPVVDLAALLEFDSAPTEREPMLVVVDDSGSQVALQVERVEGHETLLPHLAARIDLSDSAAASLATSIGGEGLWVLDIDAALADRRLTLSDSFAAVTDR